MADSDTPGIDLDLGVARLQVRGGSEDTIYDVQDVFEEQREYAVEKVEELKRLDFDLVEEHQRSMDDDSSDAPGSTHTFD